MYKPKHNKEYVGRAHLKEPIIIAGKYFGIKILSAYEFIQCSKMIKELTEKITSEGLEKSISENICEQACLVSMCLYNFQNQKVFENGLEVLKNLTPKELYFLYREYEKLLNKIIQKDKITYKILESVKNKHYKNLIQKNHC